MPDEATQLSSVRRHTV